VSLLVIFGAGASYDSVDENLALDEAARTGPQLFRPPVTADIFSPRSTFGPVLASLPRLLGLVVELRKRVSVGEALERQLDNVQVRAEAGDAIAAVQLMSLRFYLREVIESCGRTWPTMAYGATNYAWLVGRLDQWARDHSEAVTYVTFNYDTMLEAAFGSELRHGLNQFSDYMAHPRARLFKLHGSVDWGYRVERPGPFDSTDRNWLINSAFTVPTDSRIELRRDWISGIQGEAWVPALAVPIQAKGGFVCPDDHLSRLHDDLHSVDRVLAIGWRAMELHFTTMLREGLTRPTDALLAACKNSDHEAATAAAILREPDVPRRYTNIGSNMGFSDLVGTQPIEDLLAA
jgi:SIR2-like domain